MIVELRTRAQAARVAERCGGRRLEAKDGEPGRRVEVGDFEAVREQVESVTVLFGLYDSSTGEAASSGWTLSGATFEVEWPEDPSMVRSHFGGRRFAYNWALRRVKADLDARAADPEHVSVKWSLDALRKVWNEVKDDEAPWWAANSKECYSSGIADLTQALCNWKASKAGQRRGKRVGFPKFKSRRSDTPRVRFTTGTMRLTEDRRTVTVPVIGPLRSKENTRRLQRPLAQGRARILSMTVSERWGRLFVSVNYAMRTPTTRPTPVKSESRAGVDLGLRTLATIADTEGDITEVPNPAPLRATMAQRRRAGRQLSRRIPGSRGHSRAKTKLARMDRRAVHLRREAWHQLTKELAATYGEVVIEDLDLAAMKKSMGRRAFRRSVSDAALGMFAPMLTYKAERSGSRVVVADRWYPSSQLHHGCGCQLIAPHRLAKQLVCEATGELVDRDRNAALNLRDWPGHASPGSVGAGAPVVSGSGSGAGDAGSDPWATLGRERPCKTGTLVVRAVAGEARTESGPVLDRGRNPERGAA